MQALRELILSISAANIFDITIIGCLIYFVLAWLKGTRAFQILATLLGIGLFYLAASASGLILTSVLFQYLWAAIIVVLVIVFQPEIREMLDRASDTLPERRHPDDVRPDMIEEIVKQSRIGSGESGVDSISELDRPTTSF
jgi:DNA integrity scanning protein DisA with diadenylate cyclase activity